MVRTKFIVDNISKSRYGWHTIVMSSVSSGSEENKSFWAATPGGKIEMNCVNDNALQQFKVGKEYYVDFTPANNG